MCTLFDQAKQHHTSRMEKKNQKETKIPYKKNIVTIPDNPIHT